VQINFHGEISLMEPSGAECTATRHPIEFFSPSSKQYENVCFSPHHYTHISNAFSTITWRNRHQHSLCFVTVVLLVLMREISQTMAERERKNFSHIFPYERTIKRAAAAAAVAK
jgi:hypothetical protein